MSLFLTLTLCLPLRFSLRTSKTPRDVSHRMDEIAALIEIAMYASWTTKHFNGPDAAGPMPWPFHYKASGEK